MVFGLTKKKGKLTNSKKLGYAQIMKYGNLSGFELNVYERIEIL